MANTRSCSDNISTPTILNFHPKSRPLSETNWISKTSSMLQPMIPQYLKISMMRCQKGSPSRNHSNTKPSKGRPSTQLSSNRKRQFRYCLIYQRSSHSLPRLKSNLFLRVHIHLRVKAIVPVRSKFDRLSKIKVSSKRVLKSLSTKSNLMKMKMVVSKHFAFTTTAS